MRRATDRQAYTLLWASLLGGGRVRQCRECGRSALCRFHVSTLEREGWTWRLAGMRVAWTCPDCGPQRKPEVCGASVDGLRCTREPKHHGDHFDEGSKMHFANMAWRERFTGRGAKETAP